jgi:hypothetical protein
LSGAPQNIMVISKLTIISRITCGIAGMRPVTMLSAIKC